MKSKISILLVLFVGILLVSEVKAQEVGVYDCYDVADDSIEGDSSRVEYTAEYIEFNQEILELLNDRCELNVDYDGNATADVCNEMEGYLKESGYDSVEYLLCSDDTVSFCFIDMEVLVDDSIAPSRLCQDENDPPEEKDPPDDVTVEDDPEYTCYFEGETIPYSESFFVNEVIEDCEVNDDVNCGDGDLCIGNDYVSGGEYYCCLVDDPPKNDAIPITATDSNKGCNGVGEDYQSCMACMYEIGEGPADRGTDYEPTGAIWTSLGCIDPSPSGIITRLYQIGIGIVGGLILVIKVPQIVIAYNSGDPEKIKEAQSGVWSIAGGLLLLIFATAVLETLGVHVIGLPSGFI